MPTDPAQPRAIIRRMRDMGPIAIICVAAHNAGVRAGARLPNSSQPVENRFKLIGNGLPYWVDEKLLEIGQRRIR
jgi:hypothetical protein